MHGITGEDSQDPNSPSWYNSHEVVQVILYVRRLLKSGIAIDDIGIITPYTAQVCTNMKILCVENTCYIISLYLGIQNQRTIDRILSQYRKFTESGHCRNVPRRRENGYYYINGSQYITNRR